MNINMIESINFRWNIKDQEKKKTQWELIVAYLFWKTYYWILKHNFDIWLQTIQEIVIK